MPSRANARTMLAGASGFTSLPPNASLICSDNACNTFGRTPGAVRGPSISSSSALCTSSRHGNPWNVISAATSADADSAAISRPSAGFRCCARKTSDNAVNASVPPGNWTGSGPNNVSSTSFLRGPTSAGAGSPSTRANAAGSSRGSRCLPSAPSSNASVRCRSQHRSTRTPAASNAG